MLIPRSRGRTALILLLYIILSLLASHTSANNPLDYSSSSQTSFDEKCNTNADCNNRGPCLIGVCDKRESTCKYKQLEDGEACFGFEDLNVYWETKCTPTCQEQTCVVETLKCPAIACNEYLDVVVMVQKGVTEDKSQIETFVDNAMDSLLFSGRVRFAVLQFSGSDANVVHNFAREIDHDVGVIVQALPVQSSINVALETSSNYFENYSRTNARRILFLIFNCEYLLDETLMDSLSSHGIEVFAFAFDKEDYGLKCPSLEDIASVPLLKHQFQLFNPTGLPGLVPKLIDDSCSKAHKEKRQAGIPDCVNNPNDVCCSGSTVIQCPPTACNETQICISNEGCRPDVPIDCSHLDDQCSLGACDPNNGGACMRVSVSNGTSCDDGDECTELDTCQNGVCNSGFRLDCSCMEDSDVDPCVEATCINGICQMVNLPDNTSCIDMNNVGQSAACFDGVCTSICGNGMVENGEVCDDTPQGLCCTSTCSAFQNQGSRCNTSSCFQTFCNNGVCSEDSSTPLNTGIMCTAIPNGCCDGSGGCGACAKRSVLNVVQATLDSISNNAESVQHERDKLDKIKEEEEETEAFSFEDFDDEII